MTDPDPRYSLANERTFLAWIRTALGFLAAAAGVLAVDVPWPDWTVKALAVVLALTGGGSAVLAWTRWRQVERAVASGNPAPPPRAHRYVAAAVLVVAVVVAVLIVT